MVLFQYKTYKFNIGHGWDNIEHFESRVMTGSKAVFYLGAG